MPSTGGGRRTPRNPRRTRGRHETPGLSRPGHSPRARSPLDRAVPVQAFGRHGMPTSPRARSAGATCRLAWPPGRADGSNLAGAAARPLALAQKPEPGAAPRTSVRERARVQGWPPPRAGAPAPPTARQACLARPLNTHRRALRPAQPSGPSQAPALDSQGPVPQDTPVKSQALGGTSCPTRPQSPATARGPCRPGPCPRLPGPVPQTRL